MTFWMCEEPEELDREKIKCCGLVLALAIVIVVLIAYQFNFSIANWRESIFSNLGTIQLIVGIYICFIILFGYIAFHKKSKNTSYLFVILIGISLLATTGIGILTIVAGFFTTTTCAESQGILSIWEGIDNYLIEVDRTLCSSDCPCYFKNSTSFKQEDIILTQYIQWTKSTVETSATNFLNCTEKLRQNVEKKAQQLDNKFDPNNSFNETAFATSFGFFETYFNCSGWCTTEYNSTDITKPKQKMKKYLFSDVGKGPVQHEGCLNSIIDWLPPFLKAVGVIALVLGVVQLFAFVMGYLMIRATSVTQKSWTKKIGGAKNSWLSPKKKKAMSPEVKVDYNVDDIKELDLNVQNVNNKSGSGSEIKSNSGGEKNNINNNHEIELNEIELEQIAHNFGIINEVDEGEYSHKNSLYDIDNDKNNDDKKNIGGLNRVELIDKIIKNYGSNISKNSFKSNKSNKSKQDDRGIGINLGAEGEMKTETNVIVNEELRKSKESKESNDEVNIIESEKQQPPPGFNLKLDSEWNLEIGEDNKDKGPLLRNENKIDEEVKNKDDVNKDNKDIDLL